MITKRFKTSNGPLIIAIPDDAKEISIDLLQRLTPEPGHSFSELETISILSGIPVETDDVALFCLQDIYDVNELSFFNDALQKLAYQIKHFEQYQAIPKKITLEVTQSHTKRWFTRRVVSNVKTVSVLSNLGIAPAGAYLEAREVIKSEYERWEKIKDQYGQEIPFNPSIEAQIRLLSLYFYCPATGEKFNRLKAVGFDQVVKKLSIVEALPIARYFFLKYPNLSKGKITPSIASLRKLKLKQE